MNNALLTVENLRVDYEDVAAVRDVSFQIEAGMVFGLIGPNGAGKTSIMNAIATLVEPTYGTIRLAGVDVLDEPTRALPRLGFMPDFPPIYEDLTVREFLELFASAYGLPRSERRSRIDRVLAEVHLTEKAHALGGGLSRGMKQRLFLAKTLLHEPDVLVLDEPASGLDPDARTELTRVIRDLGDAGRAVLVSSHILSEMKDFCNAVGVMEAGRMIVSGRIDEVLATMRPGRTMRIELVEPDDRLRQFLATIPNVRDVEVDRTTASFVLDGDRRAASELLRQLVHSDFAMSDFMEQRGNLQDIFAEVSSGTLA